MYGACNTTNSIHSIAAQYIHTTFMMYRSKQNISTDSIYDGASNLYRQYPSLCCTEWAHPLSYTGALSLALAMVRSMHVGLHLRKGPSAFLQISTVITLTFD